MRPSTRKHPSQRRPQGAFHSTDAKARADHDAKLVARLRAGDTSAFTEIIQRHRAKLFSLTTHFLRDHHDAEEIVQDAFLRLHRNIHRFRGDCSLETYLHRIAINLARNRYWFFHRRARGRTYSMDRPVSEEAGGTLADFFASPDPLPHREQATAEFQTLIDSCMAHLDPQHREILTLRNVLNQSYGEIAAALGVEEGTVKSRIARARQGLRRLLAATCPDFGDDAQPSDWLEMHREASASGQKTG